MKSLTLVIFLVCGIFFSETVYADNQLEIKITEDGFNPPSLIIDKDTTVRFVNQDQTDHWPAADVHPTHTIYSEFDPKKPIHKEQSWQFKFTKSGKWTYHDHLLPHQKGVIIVSGEVLGTISPFNSFWKKITGFIIKRIVKFSSVFKNELTKEEFKKNSEQDQFTALRSLSQRKSVDYAWKFIQDAYDGEVGDKGRAHDLAHFMGGLIFENKGFDGMGICTPTFAFGCYHGFLDQAFKNDLSQLDKAAEGCSKIGQGGPMASCIHGIGHGVASFYKTADLSSALLSCDKLSQGATYCHDGVFMEFGRNAAPNFYKVNSFLYPCDYVDEKYVFSCGRNQPNVLMQRFNFSFDDVGDLCLNAQNEDFKLACFDSLGFIAASSSSGSANKILDSCNKIGDVKFRAKCATAAAGELIFQDVVGWREEAPKVCDSLGDFKSDCTKHLQNLMTDYAR